MINKKEKIDIKLTDMKVGNDYYFQAENLHIGIETTAIIITNISDSLKWGKTCERYSLSFKDEITDLTLQTLQSIIDRYRLGLNDLLDNTVLTTLKTELKTVYDIHLEVIHKEIKGVYTYSPFVEIERSRAKFPDKRFGRWQLIKFILAGKTTLTNLEMIKQIVETPAKDQNTTLETKKGDYAIFSFDTREIDEPIVIETIVTKTLKAVA